MAGIDTGGHGAARATNHEIPLIPFIDFLLCLVMFLLATAVWNQLARVEANANVPGLNTNQVQEEESKELHVFIGEESVFQLKWKQGATVVHALSVSRQAIMERADVTYPELAEVVKREWRAHGQYKAAGEKRFDRAILHTDNATEFSQVMATLDAIYAAEREFALPGQKSIMVPAFLVSFAAQ